MNLKCSSLFARKYILPEVPVRSCFEKLSGLSLSKLYTSGGKSGELELSCTPGNEGIEYFKF